MIFNTLDEGLMAIDHLGNYNPDNIIKSFDMDLHYSNLMPNSINGYTFPLTRTLFINSKYMDKNTEVHPKCHEIIHCLVDNNAEPLLESSYVSNSRIEARANNGAFYIMIKWYLQLTGIEPSDFNILRFKEAFNLDPKLIYPAANVAEKIINKHIQDHEFYY